MRSIHLLYKHMQRAALGLYKLQAKRLVSRFLVIIGLMQTPNRFPRKIWNATHLALWIEFIEPAADQPSGNGITTERKKKCLVFCHGDFYHRVPFLLSQQLSHFTILLRLAFFYYVGPFPVSGNSLENVSRSIACNVLKKKIFGFVWQYVPELCENSFRALEGTRESDYLVSGEIKRTSCV